MKLSITMAIIGFLLGLSLLLAGLFIKSTLTHDIKYWKTAETCCLYFSIIGFALLAFPVWGRIVLSENKNYTPGQIISGIIFFPLYISACFVGVIMMGKVSEKLNTALCHYYLDKDGKTTNAIIVDEQIASFNVRGNLTKQKFYIIEYESNGLAQKVSLKADANASLKPEEKVVVRYSESHPSFIELVLQLLS